ncbi:MAG: hypothetical protein ACOC9Q_02430 [bacterium]
MTTLSELESARATAAARYVAAVDEFIAAYVDLAGHDAALNNRRVIAARTPPGSTRTFPNGDSNDMPREFKHPEFATAETGNLKRRVRARQDELLAALTL